MNATVVDGPTPSHPHLPPPLPTVVCCAAVGVGVVALVNTTNVCFNSLTPVKPSSDGGTPSWVWAIVGTVVGLAVVTVLVGVLVMRRRRRAKAAANVAGPPAASEEGGDSLSALKLSGGATASWDAHASGLRSAGTRGSGELQSTFMRTR